MQSDNPQTTAIDPSEDDIGRQVHFIDAWRGDPSAKLMRFNKWFVWIRFPRMKTQMAKREDLAWSQTA